MKKLKIGNAKIGLIFFFLVFNSCEMLNSNKHLIGRYYLKHDKFGKALCYQVNDDGDCVELIHGAFGPIGFDDNYIILEQSEYDYLIIPVYQKFTYFPEKGILGPFSLIEFNKQKKKLHIKADFTINTN